jgi:hypothetical protein
MMNGTKIIRETRMKPTNWPQAWARPWSQTLTSTALALALAGLVPSSAAVETFTASSSADKPVKGQKPKAAKAPKPTSDKGSAEGRTERDKRLLRECRGRPNAGACEGYAS